MAGIQRLSSHVIDYAERLSNMADAAEGKHRHSGGTMGRWVVLPATGAALYALVQSDFFSRRAKGVVDEAKTRASELPDELVARVRQTTARTSSQSGSGQRSSVSSSSRRKAAPRKRTSRKTTAAR
jgi:hypothetical protein